jgi:hypothetical protein
MDLKKIDFIIKGIIVYIFLGFAFCAANELALKYVYWGNIPVVLGFVFTYNRLLRDDKQKNIKIFNRINAVYIFFLITFATILLHDIFFKINI